MIDPGKTPRIAALGAALDGLETVGVFGRVAGVQGLLVEVAGPSAR